ncbi:MULTISPECIES: beta-xylosidase [Paenibacillus]|uniref:Xylan 1,4-beta-xylosidase n=1 Tax=Paenibacillus pabuli TaxID=1472 RepID=A0A855YBB4_9BACL|nr:MULTISPECIES: beta-xylosidase [Paenibacillus]PWW38885.1 xylan 1,4-beta-xylosidase [Paenibacillus pabuli]PXW06070.1 xylan 1,4-beta-xylosidase [Paenibacillus taichungensis]SEK61943.1 xylan 1,4-beta-xylosidase [Paenibacillus sp. OK003]
MKANFTVNLTGNTEAFPHYWELCVGSCHAYTALRADYQRMLKRAHDELGFKYVRFHGLLDDNMSVYTVNMLTGQELYSFHNIDVIFDFLLSIGMKPFIELGFMPSALASGEQTCFLYKGNITPPKNYDKWFELLNTLTKHLVDRYGIDEVRTWFFEIWNEPNLKYFWAGTKDEYMKLYDYSSRAIKQVDSLLKVGGPASSGNAWIPDFIAYCEENKVAVDFISTHHYPTTDPLSTHHEVDIEAIMKMDEEEKMLAFAALMNPHYERGVMAVMTQKAKQEAGELPLYYTEWNSAAFPYKQDDPYAAAFIVKTLTDNVGLVEGYSFWTFSDIFEESVQQSLPFHGGFGLLNIDGVPKPSYHAFRVMHDLGNERIPTETCEVETLELLATKKNAGLSMVLYNHNAPEAEIVGAQVCITFLGDLTGKKASIQIIDEYHANPKRKWVEQGSPEYPTKHQLEELLQASEVIRKPVELKQLPGGEWYLELTVEPHSVTSIDIE